MVEAAERGDFAAARAMHNRILPLMQVNFVESNPVPGQGRDGGDGTARRALPAADVFAAAAIEREDPPRAEGAQILKPHTGVGHVPRRTADSR